MVYWSSNRLAGDAVYLGVVDSVAKGINASFVIFDGDKKGFLLNEKEQPLFINKKNTDKICQGDKFPIQVKNDRIKTKDYSLTCNLSLKSENLIIFLQENNISISKKISDSKRRENIRNLLKSNFPDYGFLVRTSAAKLEDEAIFNEASNLVKRLVDLLAKSRYGSIVESPESILAINSLKPSWNTSGAVLILLDIATGIV